MWLPSMSTTGGRTTWLRSRRRRRHCTLCARKEAAVSQEFMKYQHLLNTDEENEHKVIQKIFDTIRETLSAK